MADIQFRAGEKKFYDNKNFPRGFAKSGDFTIREEELLIDYGDTMSGLETGRLTPENTEEQQFLNVLNTPELAETKLEKTWLKYLKLTRGKKKFYTLNCHKKSFASESLVDLEEDMSDTDYDD